MDQFNVCVVIPTLNEAESIHGLVEFFTFNRISVIVVDDNSTDATRELAYNAGYDYGLKAAREAVAALPIMKIAGNFPLCDTDDALAAIDSLRGNDESSQTM